MPVYSRKFLRKKALLFLKKKKQKNFWSCGPWQHRRHSPQLAKVFCFFFSKKKLFLTYCLALAACAQTEPPNVMNVADAAIAGGDPGMALQVSQSALAAAPDDLDALYHEGAAYYALGRCMDSIAAYRLALSRAPGSAAAELGIGRCLLRRDPAAAEQAFAAAIADDPGNAAAFNDLGIARDLQGRHQAAVKPYEEALLLQPGDIPTEVNLGLSLALAGDATDALQYLGPLAASAQATPKIRQDYATALIAAGRFAQARRVLAIDLPPDQIDRMIAGIAAAIGGTPPPPPAAPPANPVAPAAPVNAAPLPPPA
jgi:Flp pilus assembly protein TadD